MVSINKIKIEVVKVADSTAHFSVEENGARKDYQGKIVNGGGIFGIEFPDELAPKLHGYPAENERLINEVYAMFEQQK